MGAYDRNRAISVKAKLRGDNMYTIEKVKEYIESNSNCKLLSKEYINCSTKLKIQCECGEIYFQPFSHIKQQKKIQCPKCSKKANDRKMFSSKEDVLKRIKDIIKNDYSLIEFNYIGIKNTKIKLKCNKCDFIFERNLKVFLRRGTTCPHCESANKIWTKKDVQNLINKYSNEFDVIEYKNQREILVEHNVCGYRFNKFLHNITQNNVIKCPKCDLNKSMGEEKIKTWLDNNSIRYERQKRFKNCKNIKSLPFDFYLPERDILIEFDGIQHYEVVEHFGGKEKFKIRKENDNIKNKFCIDNNIDLIRIKYSDINNVEEILTKLLIS